MNTIQIIDLKKTLLEDNDADADLLRRELLAERTFYLNVMSSPGSGKTSSMNHDAFGNDFIFNEVFYKIC